eukprot:g13625.t1
MPTENIRSTEKPKWTLHFKHFPNHFDDKIINVTVETPADELPRGIYGPAEFSYWENRVRYNREQQKKFAADLVEAEQARDLLRNLPPDEAFHDLDNCELLTYVERWMKSSKFAMQNLRDEGAALRIATSCQTALNLAVKKLEDRTGKSYGKKAVHNDTSPAGKILEIHEMTSRILKAVEN